MSVRRVRGRQLRICSPALPLKCKTYKCFSKPEDEVKLSDEALAALNEFYAEQELIRESEENSKLLAESSSKMQFQENWQLSQFWYDQETADTLAKEALKVAGDNGRISCVSCPTIYKRLAEIKPDNCITKIFEFDSRFAAFGEDFVFYDYKEPLKPIPESWRNSFDLVIADPPFLSKDCLTKISETIKVLAKQRIILCTGATMESLAEQLLNLHLCRYRPHHERQLQNEFRCYANYDLDASIDKEKNQ